MSQRDWLSLAEIARLWSAECGKSAEDIERDLGLWFSDFVARDPSQQMVSVGGNGANGDNTNRLMGMLGGRHLERQTLEAYCEERGLAKPKFWFNGPIPMRRTAKPAAGDARGAPPQGAQAPVPSVAGDPDLEIFQTQIADLSARLKAPGFDYANLEKSVAALQADAGPDVDKEQQALIEQAEAASAKARELKAQLEAAEKRIADLTRPEPAGQETGDPETAEAEPNSPPAQRPATRPAAGPPAEAGYRDPSVTSQLLHHGAPRKGRGRPLVLAGLAVPLAALALWGGLTVIHTASEQPIPPPTFATSGDLAQTYATSPAYTTSQSFEPGAAPLTNGTAPLTNGAEASQPAAGAWPSVVSNTSADDLTTARDRLEAALPGRAVEAGSSDKRLLLAAEIAWAQAALYKEDLERAMEQLEDSRLDAQTANARAQILANELIDARERHSAAVEVADADDSSVRKQLAREALTASNRATAMERDLSAAQQRISALRAQLSAANSKTINLTRQLAQLRKEHAALLERLGEQSNQSRP